MSFSVPLPSVAKETVSAFSAYCCKSFSTLPQGSNSQISTCLLMLLCNCFAKNPSLSLQSHEETNALLQSRVLQNGSAQQDYQPSRLVLACGEREGETIHWGLTRLHAHKSLPSIHSLSVPTLGKQIHAPALGHLDLNSLCTTLRISGNNLI